MGGRYSAYCVALPPDTTLELVHIPALPQAKAVFSHSLLTAAVDYQQCIQTIIPLPLTMYIKDLLFRGDR